MVFHEDVWDSQFKHRTVAVKPGQALNSHVLRCVRRQFDFDSMGLIVSFRSYNGVILLCSSYIWSESFFSFLLRLLFSLYLHKYHCPYPTASFCQ